MLTSQVTEVPVCCPRSSRGLAEGWPPGRMLGIIFKRTRKIKKYLKHTSEQFKEDTEEIRVEKLES